MDSGSALTIGSSPLLPGIGTVNGANDLTKELPGLLVLSSNNTGFSGRTFVNQGALRLQDPGALGTGSAATQVLDGAQIQLAGGVVVNRSLEISGTGIFGSGALRNISGDNTWAGAITLNTLPGFSPNTFPAGSVVFGVDNAGETLTISGAIGQNAPTGLTKVGSGELALANANTYSGATEVTDGILDVRDPGALGLRTGTASVQRIVTLSAEQLGNFRLSFNGQLTATIPWGASAAAVQSALNGLSSIGGVLGSVTVTRTEIQTTTQNGPGAANTGFLYTVTFGGTLANTLFPLQASGQAGTGASASVVSTAGVDVRVANGAALELTSSGPGFTVSNHLLTASGNGVNGTGALHNVAGNNTWNGPVSLPVDTTVGVDATTTLTLGGGVGVGGAGVDLTKVEGGTLIFPTGTPANNQAQTVASEGTVQVDGIIGNVVLDGGTISGTGTVGTIFSTINGGTVEPGDTVPASALGTLTAAGGTLSPSDVLFVNLSNPGVPTSDLLNVTGTIDLGGASLAGLVTPTVVVGNQFTILQTGPNGVIGQFAGQSTAPVAGGLSATIAYIDNQKFVVDYFSNHVVLTRQLANVTMALAPSIASPVYGERETFVASFTPESASLAVSGNVIFNVTDPSGNPFQFTVAINPATNSATLDLAAALGVPMVLGTYTVVSATYNGLNSSGTPAFNSASAGPVSVVVTPAGTTTTIQTSQPINAMFGVSITFTATVTTVVSSPVAGIQSPRGSVTFFDGATPLGTVSLPNGTGPSAVVTFSTSALSPPLSVGTHSITAVYNSDGTPDNYLGSTSPAISQTVISSDTTVAVGSSANPSAFGQPVTFTATISGVGAGTPTGTVTFRVGSTILAQNVSVIGGVATYTTTAFQLPGGANQTITATYSGDGNFNPSSGTLLQTVVGLGTTTGVTSSVNPSVFGQPVTFTATVTPTSSGGAVPTGQVLFRIGSTVLGTGTLNGSAVATYTTSAGQLPLGASTITAEYVGDSNYATSLGTVTQNVGVSATTTTLTSSNAQGVRTRAFTFTATVAPVSPGAGIPTGQVTFTDTRTGFILGTATLNSSGVAILVTALQNPLSPAAPLGNHVIRADYLEAGDVNYTASSGAVTVNLVANGTRASTVILKTSGSPSIIGNDVTFTATVRDAGAAPTSNPIGTVLFFDTTTNTILGYATLSQVSAGVMRTTFTTNALGLGTHNIQARYSGSGLFAVNNTTSLNQVVKPIPTRTSSTGLTQSLATTVFGQAVTFTATVTDTGGGTITPTGTVTFRDTTTGQVLGTGTLSQVSLGVGRATLVTNLLDVGSHDIVAEYGGDTDFAAGAASAAVTHVVNEASTTTGLTTSVAQSRFGQAVTLRATVVAVAPGGGFATGNVTFTDTTTGQVLGTVALNANGVATLTTSVLGVGTHAIQATYDGSDANFLGSSGSVTQTVLKSQTKATLTRTSAANPPGAPSDANKPVNLIAGILPVAPGAGTPTGSVTFIIDGVVRGIVALTNGQAVLFLPGGLSIGSHNIQVQYAGDANYLAVNKTFTFNFTVGRGT